MRKTQGEEQIRLWTYLMIWHFITRKGLLQYKFRLIKQAVSFSQKVRTLRFKFNHWKRDSGLDTGYLEMRRSTEEHERHLAIAMCNRDGLHRFLNFNIFQQYMIHQIHSATTQQHMKDNLQANSRMGHVVHGISFSGLNNVSHLQKF
jgi:hypothetical protein